jgi:nucleoside-diphosphate-sugar epimerase
MSVYLVTGGAGFIGSNIVNELLARNNKVRVLDNYSTGKRENLMAMQNNPNLEIIEGDLRSFHIVRDAVKGVNFVLHLGALPSVPRSIKDPITSNDVNILGTLNILEAAMEYKIQRVVYASSSSVYGNNESMLKTETLPVMPLSPYAISKYAAERYCQVYYQLYGLETVSLRYFNVFGPRQDASSQYSAVIPKFIELMRKGKRPVIYGDGLQSRDFTFVANVVEANLLACTSDNVAGEVFNIACKQSITLLDVVNSINEILGTQIQPEFVKEAPGDVKHSLADIDKAKANLHYTVKVQFKEGLEKLMALK